MDAPQADRLKGPRHPLLDFVAAALVHRGLLDA
jgi:hypothetical protein